MYILNPKLLKLIILLSLIFTSSSYSTSPGWKKVDTREDIPDGYTDSYYARIRCADSMNCMIWTELYGAGGYYLRRTTDGGLTWKNVFMDSAYVRSNTDKKYVPQIRELAYPNKKLFIAVGDSGLILRSTDQGDTWQKTCLDKNFQLKQIRMLDENYGILKCGYYPIPIEKIDLLETTDGGITWNKMNKPANERFGFKDIDIINRNLFYAIVCHLDSTPEMKLLKVQDNWKKWDTLSIPDYVMYMDFINENQGWVCGGYQNSSSYSITTQRICYTSDGGKSWTKQRDTIYNGFTARAIRFFDEKFGIAESCLSLLLLTTNGGKNWQEIELEPWDPYSGHGYCIISPVISGIHTAYCLYDGDYVYKYTRDMSAESVSPQEDIGISIGNIPYPFSDESEICYTIDKPCFVRIKLYDILGNESCTLANEYKENGIYTIKLSLNNIPSGIYFLRMKTENKIISKQIYIIK